MLIIDYTNHRHWLLGMSFISGCGRGDSIVLQNIVDRCTIRQIIGQKQTAEIYLLMTNIDNYYFSNNRNFNLYFYYSETCLNQTLSKPKTCLNRTLSKPKTCLNRTLSKPKTCLNRTLSKPKTCLN